MLVGPNDGGKSAIIDAICLVVLQEAPMFVAMILADTVPPDVRVAVATEALFWATLALAIVGALTLFAAVVAAVYAVMAYRLEASPGVVIALHPMAAKAALPQTTAYRVVREPLPIRWNDPPPAPTIRPLRQSDELPVMALDVGYVEVRNVGRSAIVEARIAVRIRTKDLGKMNAEGSDIEMHEVVGDGVIRVASIAADSAVLLPIVGLPNGCEITVQHVTSHRPAFVPGEQKQTRLPFVASDIHIATNLACCSPQPEALNASSAARPE
jgi:hypothetical protein